MMSKDKKNENECDDCTVKLARRIYANSVTVPNPNQWPSCISDNTAKQHAEDAYRLAKIFCNFKPVCEPEPCTPPPPPCPPKPPCFDKDKAFEEAFKCYFREHPCQEEVIRLYLRALKAAACETHQSKCPNISTHPCVLWILETFHELLTRHCTYGLTPLHIVCRDIENAQYVMFPCT